MFHCVITPVSDYFVLKIHYEHPVQVINGSYVFLYDLNIREYLSHLSPNSTAYFTMRIETNASNMQAFTTETDSAWNLIDYTTSQEGAMEVIAIQIYSERSKLLSDLVITFSGAEIETTAVPSWVIISVLLFVGFLAVIIYRRVHRQKASPRLQK
jgi:hypothetical protein